MTCYVLIESSLVWLLKNKGTTEITSRELLLFGHTSVFMIPPRLRDISKTLFSDNPINIHKVAQHVPDVPIIFVKHAVKTVMLSLICDPCLLGQKQILWCLSHPNYSHHVTRNHPAVFPHLSLLELRPYWKIMKFHQPTPIFFLMVYALNYAKTPIPIPRRGQGTLRVVSFCAPCAVANLEFISSTWIRAKMIPQNHRAYIGFDVGRIHESLDLSWFPYQIIIYIYIFIKKKYIYIYYIHIYIFKK